MSDDDILVFLEPKEGAGPEMDPHDRAIIEEAIRDFRERLRRKAEQAKKPE